MPFPFIDSVTDETRHIRIPRARVYAIREAIGQWGFSAHDYSEEELVFCAQLMFEHAFKMPEAADYRISPGETQLFFIILSTLT